MWKRFVKVGMIAICVLFLFAVASKQESQQTEINQTPDKIVSSEVSDTKVAWEEQEPVFELAYNPLVRVVLSDASFEGIIHANVLITSGQAYELLGSKGQLFAEYEGGKTIDFSDFNMKEGESLIVASKTGERFSVDSLTRTQGVPFYRGRLQIYKEKNGYVIVNELPLEEYLLTVVPSEMPSSYPADALAAQAVCARSYAYSFLYEPGYPRYNAHMDDSTSYQVYNNIEETESTTVAVAETRGTVLLKDGKPMSTFFFSTSCGITSTENVWSLKNDVSDAVFQSVTIVKDNVDAVETMAHEGDNMVFSAEALCDNDTFTSFIKEKDENALEAEEQWYRWTYKGKIQAEDIFDKLNQIYKEKPEAVKTKTKNDYVEKKPDSFQAIQNIRVVKRLPGGVADELLIETDSSTFLIKSEFYIRKVLADETGTVIRNDNTKVNGMKLLPSAYFVIEQKKNKKDNVSELILTGGGYGHGVGMSQNGAKCAAQEGMKWNEILQFFYSNLELVKVEK